ncbi:endonuclease MutS2 [Myroides sp. C15-4]|uniref:endonuclease MutS2 n=1 Tax=Myroides sp. C15-4 TaxID=3400532 RepID=UPI003D2F978C
MIYPTNYEDKCGFTTIREILIAACLSPYGIEKIEALTFQTDFETINQQLDEIVAFRKLLSMERHFPLEQYKDMRGLMQAIKADDQLWCTVEELLDLQQLLRYGEKVHHIAVKTEEEVYCYPLIAKLAADYKPMEVLTQRLNQVIDPMGQIRDSATKALGTIRKEQIQVAHVIQKKFDVLWRKAQAAGLIDSDLSASERDGRMVIPITASFKRRFKGVVHDESRSGKTVFMEPEELVQDHTRLFVLEQEERREVVRILLELTALIRAQDKQMNALFTFLGTMDFLRAKVVLADKIGGVKPNFEAKTQLEWIKAYHPVLAMRLKEQGKTLHPLTLTLNKEHRILLVSGANSGGKSVTLKTVALLQYMLQCGLLLPVDPQSKVGVFDQILMDIGDGQSIENNLSTYTAHLNTMQLFLTHTQASTLILIDEFGGGTEPELGGAIAESILETLNQRSCYGMITTHFYNLKGFAQRTKGLQNGAMLYDFKEMRPLYQLSQGHPGSSYALDVARQIGLTEAILTQASSKIDADYLRIEEQLQQVVAAKVQELKEQEALTATEITAERAVVEQVIETSSIIVQSEQKIAFHPPTKLKVGDQVKRQGRGKTGTILEIRSNKALVLIENLKFTIALDELVSGK